MRSTASASTNTATSDTAPPNLLEYRRAIHCAGNSTHTNVDSTTRTTRIRRYSATAAIRSSFGVLRLTSGVRYKPFAWFSTRRIETPMPYAAATSPASIAPCVESSMDRANRYASGDVSANTYIEPANDVRPCCDRSAMAAVDALVFDG